MNPKPASFRYRIWTTVVVVLALAACAGVWVWFGHLEDRLHRQQLEQAIK